jgi:hypothetical protein
MNRQRVEHEPIRYRLFSFGALAFINTEYILILFLMYKFSILIYFFIDPFSTPIIIHLFYIYIYILILWPILIKFQGLRYIVTPISFLSGFHLFCSFSPFNVQLLFRIMLA